MRERENYVAGSRGHLFVKYAMRRGLCSPFPNVLETPPISAIVKVSVKQLHSTWLPLNMKQADRDLPGQTYRQITAPHAESSCKVGGMVLDPVAVP